MIGFTKAMDREVGYNITVNAFCPGYVLTPMVKEMALRAILRIHKVCISSFKDRSSIV
ncbi:hypothetical protein LJE72_23255 [Desulfosporosinus sp. SRJS8]|nr:hypothetical protein [Desulfosporosinus sp. SRJS8]